MKINVRFRDGFTGGVLTTEHSQSSYGFPVFVPNDYTRDYLPEDCYGPGDLTEDSPLVPLEDIEPDTLRLLRELGFKVEIE